jgi:hypothetical protein
MVGKQKNRETTWAKFHGNRAGDALTDAGLLFLSGADGFLIEDRHVSKTEVIYRQQYDQGTTLALVAAVPEGNVCIGAYQLCQAQYPNVCSGKLP